MPEPTYTPMANLTLSTAASSVTFSSILQTYQHLVLVVSGNGTAALNFNARLNGDTSANYPQLNMRGGGGAFTSNSTGASIPVTVGAEMSTTQSNYVIHLLGYSATDKWKTVLSRGSSTDYGTNAVVTQWGSLSAITEVRLFTSSSTFAAGCSFSLYGIRS